MSTWTFLERLFWAGLGGFVAIVGALVIGRIKAVHPAIKVWACRLAIMKMLTSIVWGIEFRVNDSLVSRSSFATPVLGSYLVACWAIGFGWVMYNFARSLLAVKGIVALSTEHDGWASLIYKKGIKVREIHGISEPCVCGILRPSLVLPKGWRYNQGILVHEWAHIQHGDLQWNALSWLSYAVFWFIPGQAKLNAEMNLWQEARADLVARERLGVSASNQAQTLLLAVEKTRLPAPLMLGQAGHAASVARRLEALYCKRYSLKACAALTVVILLLCVPVRMTKSEINAGPIQTPLSIASPSF